MVRAGDRRYSAADYLPMRINEDDSDKLIMTRRLLTRRRCHVSHGHGNYAGKTLRPGGITSAITIIINQIYRATKAKNLLTRGTKRERAREGEEKKRGGINRSLAECTGARCAGWLAGRLTGYDTGSARDAQPCRAVVADAPAAAAAAGPTRIKRE